MDQLTDRDRAGVVKLRKLYADVAPYLFARSVGRARDLVEFFEIIDTMPPKLPVVWDPGARRWKPVSDLMSQRAEE